MTAAAIRTALDYLAAMEARDFDRARSLVAREDLQLTFPGGRRFTAIEQIAANSAGRYQRVQKTITGQEAFETEAGRTVVYISGTLYGLWADGTPFEGIRFVDRFEILGALIRRQDVWNDSGEARLARQSQEM